MLLETSAQPIAKFGLINASEILHHRMRTCDIFIQSSEDYGKPDSLVHLQTSHAGIQTRFGELLRRDSRYCFPIFNLVSPNW